jgi:2-methylcitrate dehydratase PrpD
MDAAFAIAKHIVNLKYDDIPPEIVEITKKEILDILGVISAASAMGQASQEIVKLVKESGARGKSTIIGHGGRLPSWMAGFANGSMAHELDYDDIPHVSSSVVPSAFAVAEEVGGVSGKEFLATVALAVDLHLRMSSAIKEDIAPIGWMESPLFGYFSATAAAGRILGLNENGMMDAFGHTLQQAAGSRQCQYSMGGVFRGIRDGFPIMGGILSALMAKRGLTGTKESLEGKAGLYNLYFRGAYDRSQLVDELGKRFRNTRVGFKPWPCCGSPITPVYGILEIFNEHDIPSANIEVINICVSEFDVHLHGAIENMEELRKPQTIMDAKFSIPFSVGVAAVRKKVTIGDFTLDGLKDPAVLQMAQKVTVKRDARLKDSPHAKIIEIKTRDGKQYSKLADITYGNYKKPITKEDLVAKFRDCVSYSAKPISKDQIEKIISMVDGLEKIKDVSRIVRMLG